MTKYKSNYNKKSNNYYRKYNNNYNNKYKHNKSNNSNLNNTDKLNLNDLETTTRIRVDDIRLNDTSSLDTSFLEGRYSKDKNKKKIIKETKSIKYTEKNLDDFNDNKKEKKKNEKKTFNKTIFFSIFIVIIIICLLVFGLFALYNVFISEINTKEKVVTKEVVKIHNDENIVFLGDSITNGYDLEKYYEGYHVVNSGIDGNKTDDILNDMYNRVYKYNPSKVFILIGTNDLFEKRNDEEKYYEETEENIKEIVENIKENREYAEIYIESIYPVNDTDDEKINHGAVGERKNSVIKNMNKKLKSLATKEKVNYIDLYSILEDEDGNLKLEYTKEGLHITEEGYEVITEELLKYINDEK